MEIAITLINHQGAIVIVSISLARSKSSKNRFATRPASGRATPSDQIDFLPTVSTTHSRIETVLPKIVDFAEPI